MNWQEAFLDYLIHDHVKRGGGELSENSLKANLQDVRHFARFAGGSFHPREMTAELVKAYFAWQDEIKAAARSRNRRLASLRNLVKFCLAEGWLDRDPTVRIKRRGLSQLPRRAKNDDEMVALQAVAQVSAHLKKSTRKYDLLGLRDKVIFGLFASAILRISEIEHADVDDLYLEQSTMRILGKGDVEGWIYLPDDLVADLREWLAKRPRGGQALITDWRGQRLSAGQIRRRLYQMADEAGVDVKPHDLRHTGIERILRTAMQGGGMPRWKAVEIAQLQARHLDKRTTEGYLRASWDEIRMVVGASVFGTLPATAKDMGADLIVEQDPRVVASVA